jgi:hypothetical protein
MSLRVVLRLVLFAIFACTGVGGAASAAEDRNSPDDRLREAQRACASTGDNPILESVKHLVRCESVSNGPIVNGRRTLEVLFADATGPNFRVQSVALVTLGDGQFREIWSHKTLDLTSKPLAPMDDAIVYHWRYLAEGREIAVTGSETVGSIDSMWKGTAHGRVSGLAPERYCYLSGQGQFERC